MQNQRLVEICCFSLFSALVAQNGGADRIELCGGFLEGGTTPSLGLVKSVLGSVKIPVRVMIRPRGGDFLYSDQELAVMLSDIEEIKKLKPEGFVFGCLNADGTINSSQLQQLMNTCYPFPMTFHRAFDASKDPLLSLETCIEFGIDTILSSGMENSALEGLDLLVQLQNKAEGKIQILAGAGVGINNVQIFANSGIQNIHLTAKKPIQSGMSYYNESLKMGANDVNELVNYEADIEIVKNVVSLFKN